MVPQLPPDVLVDDGLGIGVPVAQMQDDGLQRARAAEQRTKIEFTGLVVEGLEIIGYDPESGTFPSTVYPNMIGSPLPYRWKLDGDDVTIIAEALHATFHGRWSGDGQTFGGGWRPDPGHENDPGNIAYDVSGGRAG